MECLSDCPRIIRELQKTNELSGVLNPEEEHIAWNNTGKLIGGLAINCSGSRVETLVEEIPLRFSWLREKLGLPTRVSVLIPYVVCGLDQQTEI